MARIHSILQGFVDINLETDETISTKIVSQNTVQSVETSLITSIVLSQKSAAIDKIEMPISIDKIAEIISIEPSAIKAAHVQGSRLYGTDNLNSDWDLAIIATNVKSYQSKKFTYKGVEYDIHLYSQEGFESFIENHNMIELEFLYHPDKFRLLDKVEIVTEIDNSKLINKVKQESDISWNIAKNQLGVDGFDNYDSLKSIFHSLRLLIFAGQILENGKIIDYSGANYLYEQIVRSGQTEFAYFEATLSTLREELKASLDSYLDTNDFKGHPVIF